MIKSLLGLACLPFLLQPVDRPGPDGSPELLQRLEWMSGRWVMEREGEFLEENWLPPVGDSMLATFRWLRDGKAWLFEMMSIEVDEDGQLVFRLRHFDRGLEPWDSERDGPLTYPLEHMEDEMVVFENPDRDAPRRFVYRRDGEVLVVRTEAASGEGDEFRFERPRR